MTWGANLPVSYLSTFFVLFVFGELGWQKYWSGLPFPPPVDHILSPTLTRLSWVNLRGTARSFIELHNPLCLDQAVTHIISQQLLFTLPCASFISVTLLFLMESTVGHVESHLQRTEK